MKITMKKLILDKKERELPEDIQKVMMQERKKTLIWMLGFLILVIIFTAFVRDYISTRTNDKYSFLKQELLDEYYKPDNLTTAMKNVLDKSYNEKNRPENFDNYVLALVSKDLANYEEARWKKYTRYYPKESVIRNEELEKKVQDNLSCKLINKNLYSITFQGFKNGVTAKNIKKHTDEIKQYKNLVIDLRNNGGGDEKEAKRIADLFLPKNMIVCTNKLTNKEVTIKTSDSFKLEFNKIFILINKDTASAAEVLTLALKENLNNVTIVGKQSFGKGIGSQFRIFPDKTAYNCLAFHWISPKGNTIHNKGITPDIVVNDENKLIEVVERNIDNK